MVLNFDGVVVDVVHYLPSSDDVDNVPQSGSSSRVDGEKDPPLAENHLVLAEVHQHYLQAEAKLKRELAEILLDENIWYLKPWDLNGVGIVKTHCMECDKDFGGNIGEHNTHSISNTFANFRKHHLYTNFHIRSLCRRLGVPYTNYLQFEAPKRKSVVLTNADHKQLIKEGSDVMDEVNGMAEEVYGHKPFFIVGDHTSNGFKFCSYFKVHCRLYRDFFQLCLPKKNLEANLINHIQGYKHEKAVLDSSTSRKSATSVISMGQRGQPNRSGAACRILICTSGSSEPGLMVNKVSTICISASLSVPSVALGNPLLLGLRFCIRIRPSLD